MRYDCAPMEGITGRHFRLAHHRWFGGIDHYYLPFLSPTHTRSFSKKEWQEVLPEHNEGLCVIPQLLTRDADNFLWAAADLAALGYSEVNLNLGCPSGTVVAKGKGSGFLARPQELDAFLDKIFSACPIPISIKTRLGLTDPEEFYPLLDIFCRYPVHELIIHPRVQRDFYKLPVRREVFDAVYPDCPLPLCYNGDVYTAQQCGDIAARYPALRAVMLGRGLIAAPRPCPQGRRRSRRRQGDSAGLSRRPLRKLLHRVQKPPQRHDAHEGALVLPDRPVRKQRKSGQGAAQGP